MKKITGNHMNGYNNNTISGVLNCYHELVEHRGKFTPNVLDLYDFIKSKIDEGSEP